MSRSGNKLLDEIVRRAGIDVERITITTKDYPGEDPGVVVHIAACTEREQRATEAVMRQFSDEIGFRVVGDPTPAKPPVYDLDNLKELIVKLGDAPDGQLDKMFSLRCRNFPEDATLEDTLRFLRNLRDECVYCAGGSGFVMTLFNSLLEDYPEPEDVMAERRAELERRYNM